MYRDADELSKASSGEGRGMTGWRGVGGKGMLRNWQKPGAGRGGEEGGGGIKDGNGEGETGRGNGDREMGRGGVMGRGKWGIGEGRGQQGGGEGARRGRISQMDTMECPGGHRL